MNEWMNEFIFNHHHSRKLFYWKQNKVEDKFCSDLLPLCGIFLIFFRIKLALNKSRNVTFSELKKMWKNEIFRFWRTLKISRVMCLCFLHRLKLLSSILQFYNFTILLLSLFWITKICRMDNWYFKNTPKLFGWSTGLKWIQI